MKNIRLIYGLVLGCIALFNNLLAGPVYASKWKKGEQIILLYGDQHNTHTIDGAREHESIAAFKAELEAVTEDTLVLCEDATRPLCSAILSD